MPILPDSDNSVRCQVCDAAVGEDCERFDHVSRLLVPLGYSHSTRLDDARDASRPMQLVLL